MPSMYACSGGVFGVGPRLIYLETLGAIFSAFSGPSLPIKSSKKFLKTIGYLKDEGPDFKIQTTKG